jgi:hypothetical protein
LIQLQPLSVEFGQGTAIIAIEHQIRGCDAVNMALVEQLAPELVTLDKQQLERGDCGNETAVTAANDYWGSEPRQRIS